VKLCIVTCTGGRPEFFSLCKRWVERQTMRPDFWVVGLDVPCDVGPLPKYAQQVHLPSVAHLQPTLRAHTSLSNLLRHVPTGHHAVIFEDDDWYAPNYAAVLHWALSNYGAVAPEEEFRYNLVSRRYQKFGIAKSANAGSTAIHAGAIETYAGIVGLEHGGDNKAWDCLEHRRVPGTRRVAMKGVGHGLPGRDGATQKHRPEFTVERRWAPDPDLSLLRSMIGTDLDLYLETFPALNR
jgi:hypothetical protein